MTEVKTTHRISDSTYRKLLLKLEKERDICPENRIKIVEFLKHLELGKNIGRQRRRSIHYNTLYKYLIILKRLARAFNKPFADVTQEEIDTYRIQLKHDTTLSIATKMDIEYKVLRMLFIWLGKPELVFFFNEYVSKREIPALKREQIHRMTLSLKLRDRLIIWLLFDGGFRAQEFLNIRFSDVNADDKGKNGYKIRIRISKTYPRTVSVGLCTELLDSWMEENKEKVGTDAPLVSLSYAHLRNMIEKVAQKYLGADWVTPHVFRHSSATYYCRRMGQYDLCKRYGWSMASDMPKCYIDREGVDDGAIGEAIVNEEAATFKEENRRLKEEVSLLKEQMQSLSELVQRAMVTPKAEIQAAIDRKKGAGGLE